MLIALLTFLNASHGLEDTIKDAVLFMKQINTFEFDNIDERQEKAKEILDRLKPSNKISTALPYFAEVKEQSKLNDIFHNGLYEYLGVENISREDFREYLLSFAKPAYKIWKDGNLVDAVNSMIDKSVYDGILKAGFDMTNSKRVFEIIDQAFSGNEIETLKTIIQEFLDFDFEPLHSHLYDELITEGRANINIITDDFFEGN